MCYAIVALLRWTTNPDGAAPQSPPPGNPDARSTTFRLAEPAPIAGLVVQLCTGDERSGWPDRLTLDLSSDGMIWDAALTVDLTASDLPQIFALPQVTDAACVGVTRHGCRADPACALVALADLGLEAAPGWHPVQPIDIAYTSLGGRVIAALALGGKDRIESPFPGKWNDGLLTTGNTEELAAATPAHGDRIEAILGFAANRAARVASVEWQGPPWDRSRLDGSVVGASLNGPEAGQSDCRP